MTGSLFLFCLTSLFLYNQAVKYTYGCEYFTAWLYKSREVKQRINKLPVIAHHHLCTITTCNTHCISAGLGIDICINQEIVKV